MHNAAQPASSEERLLRVAFLAGAIADAAALLPMLIPRLAGWLWGFHDISGSYRFAMGYGASLMSGWTLHADHLARRSRDARPEACIPHLLASVALLAAVAGIPELPPRPCRHRHWAVGLNRNSLPSIPRIDA